MPGAFRTLQQLALTHMILPLGGRVGERAGAAMRQRRILKQVD
jgi:hypothetical protein